MIQARTALALTLVGAARAAGDFSFDVPINAASNMVVMPLAAEHRLSASHTVSAVARTAVAGVDQVAVRRQLNKDINTNYAVRVTPNGRGRGHASHTGSPTGAYEVVGTSQLADDKWHSLTTAFDADVSATLVIDNIVEAVDFSVASASNPAVLGVMVGCGDTTGGPNPTCEAATDHLGMISGVRIYSELLTSGELSQLGYHGSYRRPFRDQVLHLALHGRPGTGLGAMVPDWSQLQVHGDGSSGVQPTYVPSYTRGAGR